MPGGPVLTAEQVSKGVEKTSKLDMIRGISDMGVSKNNGTPKSSILIGFSMVFHYKPSILGYPYFWKHPHEFFGPWKSMLLEVRLLRVEGALIGFGEPGNRTAAGDDHLDELGLRRSEG